MVHVTLFFVKFLLRRCDSCKQCYHFQCLDPPIKVSEFTGTEVRLLMYRYSGANSDGHCTQILLCELCMNRLPFLRFDRPTQKPEGISGFVLNVTSR